MFTGLKGTGEQSGKCMEYSLVWKSRARSIIADALMLYCKLCYTLLSSPAVAPKQIV